LSIRQQLERSKVYVCKRFKTDKYIAYFQSFSNTYAPIDQLRRLYDEALSVEGVVGLSIGTRPDCINTAVLELLADYARRYHIWLEYGLQSANDDTLLRINRGHDWRCFEQAVWASKPYGLNLCAHVILGLPGETRRDNVRTAQALAALGIDAVKLHLLYVVRGTAMEKLYRAGRYQCLSMEHYAEWVGDFLANLPGSVVIQRLTGDPHPRELVAPEWALDKKGTLERIESTLVNRNTWQGQNRGEPLQEWGAASD
jgi:radical SAM protein (TIGR01212 family)